MLDYNDSSIFGEGGGKLQPPQFPYFPVIFSSSKQSRTNTTEIEENPKKIKALATKTTQGNGWHDVVQEDSNTQLFKFEWSLSSVIQKPIN